MLSLVVQFISTQIELKWHKDQLLKLFGSPRLEKGGYEDVSHYSLHSKVLERTIGATVKPGVEEEQSRFNNSPALCFIEVCMCLVDLHRAYKQDILWDVLWDYEGHTSGTNDPSAPSASCVRLLCSKSMCFRWLLAAASTRVRLCHHLCVWFSWTRYQGTVVEVMVTSSEG